MGMLCGTLEATIGDAVVNGYSITRDRTLARRNLGICMQQDIIWNDVSVGDHLLFFGRLRGLHGSKLRQDVTAMLESLGFPEKRHAMAGTLSGGQKRRLCVGLSLVGGNAVVYLDEVSADGGCAFSLTALRILIMLGVSVAHCRIGSGIATPAVGTRAEEPRGSSNLADHPFYGSAYLYHLPP